MMSRIGVSVIEIVLADEPNPSVELRVARRPRRLPSADFLIDGVQVRVRDINTEGANSETRLPKIDPAIPGRLGIIPGH